MYSIFFGVLIWNPLVINDVEHFFMDLYIIHISLEKISIKIFYPLLIGLFLLLLSSWEFFMYSGYKSFIKCIICKYFLPLCGLAIHFLSSVFGWAEVFNFDKVELTAFWGFFFSRLCIYSYFKELFV